MSLHYYDNVNSTVIHDEEGQSLLTPGQIAAITIVSSFVFFLSLMSLVCVSEYCRYIKGRKDKAEKRRRLRHSAAYTRGVPENQHPISEAVEIGVDQSEAIASLSKSKSDSSCVDTNTSDYRTSLAVSSEPPDGSEVVDVHFEDSLDQVNLECGDSCDMSPVNYEHDTGMLPLIQRQCEDTLDTDGDIFCDSVDSRNVYRLEADV